MKKNNLIYELERVRMAIEGILAHPELLKKMAKHGYDLKKILEGKALHDQVKLFAVAKSDGMGGQKKATGDFARIRQDINKLYEYHLEVARLALREDSSLWDTLQLKGRRQHTIAPWLEQVQAFYSNIHRVAEPMSFRGVSQQELEQAQAMVEAAAALRIRQASKKGESQSATAQKKKMKKALDLWMKDFLYIARFVAKDDMQQLEALGMVVPS